MNERQQPVAEAPLSPEMKRAEVLERFAAHPFANLETYKYFNQTGEVAAAAKQLFIDAAMNGDTPEAPALHYPKLDIDTLVARRDELTEILDEVLRLDMNVEENRLLREKVTDRLHEAGIMILTKIQSEMPPDNPLYPAVSYQLGENMREVYGAPEVEHWRGILGYRLSLLAEIENREDVPPAVREAWEYVRDALPGDLPIATPYQPREETLAWYHDRLEERLSPARDALQAAIEAHEIVPNDNGELDCDNIIKATKLALAARGIVGWKVLPTDEANIDTSQELKTIFIPTKRRMTMKQFDKVMQSHEIDEHVARRDNGDKSGEPILSGTGLSGSLGWEEGNGKANEALLEGKVTNQESAFNYYLSVGLALGLDGNGTRNYGQTFDLVWRMRLVSLYLKEKLNEGEDARQVMEATYDSMNRIFRGTDGRAPGVVFPKDGMTYYLGQTDVWRKWDNDMELPEDERRAEHELERSAKISPVRPDHRRVAVAALAAK